jgi:hypothetical protein
MHAHPGAAPDTGTEDKTVYLECEPNNNCEVVPVLNEEALQKNAHGAMAVKTHAFSTSALETTF